MKTKLLCTAAALFIAAGITCHAEDYVMTFTKSDTEYDFGDRYSVVGVDKATGKPIPMSHYADGYLYAFAPEGTVVEFEQREKLTFADLDSNSEPEGLDELSVRGVFTGDENGNFNGDEILTRAQMTVLLARIIGAEGEAVGEMPFKDVDPSSWYASAVYALYSRGIIAGDDYFNPDRNVTREELITMEYRLIDSIGGKPPKTRIPEQYLLDLDTVSEYARDAYICLIGSGYGLYPLVEDSYDGVDDYSHYTYYLKPQSVITRSEACENLAYYNSGLIAENEPAIPTETAIEYGFDKEMPVITGSTSTYPMTQAIYRDMFINYSNHPIYPEAHDKTIRSYELLIDGEANIILVPDPSEEVRSLAEERDVELEYIPISNEALIFFTSSDNTAKNLTIEDIAKIYVDNSVTVWREVGGPDAKITPFCRNTNSGSHAQLEKFILNGKELNPELLENNMISEMFNILSAVAYFSEEHPNNYALGYNMYYFYKKYEKSIGDRIKLLSIDGIAPSDATLADGTYPLTTNYYAVLRADEPEGSPARKMAEYLISEQGQRSISGAGFGALAKAEEE